MEKKNSPSWDRNLFSAGSVVFLAALATFAAQAVTTNTWKTTCMAPNTPATAYLWNDPSNWDTEQVPAAYDEVVFEKPSCVYYVKLPDDPVIVSKFTNKTGDGHYMALVGGRIIYSSDSSVRAQFADGGGWVFSDIESASATDSSMPYISGVNLAGRAVATYQNFVPSSGWVSHRLDKFAYSSNPLRTDDLVVSSSHYHNPGSGNVAVYAPQGADAVTADWALSEGSPYATRVASSAHALAAGTIVSCPGVLPAGTFVKRIFSNSLIELSEPAETGATGTHALSFAAFTPEVRINLAGFSRQGSSPTEFQLYKYREQDVLRYEMTNYYGYAGQTSYFGISATQVSTGFPGTHVFHNFNDTGSKVILRNAHFELAGKTDGTATTFATNVHVSVPVGATQSNCELCIPRFNHSSLSLVLT